MPHRRSHHLAQKVSRISGTPRLPDTLASLGVAPDDVIGLEKAVYGQVVLPDDSLYDDARRLWNPAFQSYPALVVYCETAGDVKAALAFARRFGLPTTCRAGGHNTAGYSVRDGGLVIDISRIRYVRVEPEDDGGEAIAHVGAGSQWGYVGSVLDSHGLHVPGGGCESVCVAGYMQGGGYSYTSRMFGMNCDNVLEVRVMLADGRIVVANERQNFPLYWAIRGGTGNNFGVVLEVTYRLHRPDPLWGFRIRWEIENAPCAIHEMQNRYMKTNDSRLIGFQTHGLTVDGRQILAMAGMYRGSESEALEVLRPILSTPGAALEYGVHGGYFELNRRLESGLDAVIPAGAKEDKQSGYLREPLSLFEWEKVIDKFTRSPNPYSIFNIEAYGAAINDVKPGTNAFIHRDAYCDFFLDVFWVDEADREPAVRFLDEFFAMMQPYFDRPDGRAQSNQDYPRRTQTNFKELYFDGFINDLVAVKRLYDPTNFFQFEQGIPLEYPQDARVDPASPGFTGNEEIVAEQL